MSNLVCPKCRGPKKDWASVCWKCHTAAQVDAAYHRGYSTGFLEGLRKGRESAASTGLKLTTARWRQLVHLAHPDKHDGSKTAVEITQWLNEIRP